MKKPHEKMLKLHCATKDMDKMYSLYNRREYAECDDFIRERLDGQSEITRENRHFWYYRAILSDMRGDISKSVEILSKLCQQFPKQVDYLRSYNIVCDRMGYEAYDVYEKDPESPLLLALRTD